MLERLHLPHEFLRVAANFRGQHFHRPDHEIGVNDEASTDIHARSFIVDA